MSTKRPGEEENGNNGVADAKKPKSVSLILKIIRIYNLSVFLLRRICRLGFCCFAEPPIGMMSGVRPGNFRGRRTPFGCPIGLLRWKMFKSRPFHPVLVRSINSPSRMKEKSTPGVATRKVNSA